MRRRFLRGYLFYEAVMINVFYEETAELNLDQRNIESWLSSLCSSLSMTLGDVALIFCSDEYLLNINKDHLQHDYYTDIITFNYCSENTVSGDLFISVDRVRDNASELGLEFIIELLRVIAHGVLHLIGFNDKTEEQSLEMRTQEEIALKLFVSRETFDR